MSSIFSVLRDEIACVLGCVTDLQQAYKQVGCVTDL